MCNCTGSTETATKRELVIVLNVVGGLLLVIMLLLFIGRTPTKTDKELLTESASPAPFTERVRVKHETKIDLAHAQSYNVEGQIVKVRRLDGKVRRVVARA